MFRNGLYRVRYGWTSREVDVSPEVASAIFVIRDGAILGSDAEGAVYIGEVGAAPDRDDALPSRLVITCEVPPGGELVSGFLAPGEGASLAIAGHIDARADHQTAIVMVANVPVEIAVSYLGPLPA